MGKPAPPTPAETDSVEDPTARRVRVWIEAGDALVRVRREELRRLDVRATMEPLCGPADYTIPPRQARPSSGLVEQQYWFAKARAGD